MSLSLSSSQRTSGGEGGGNHFFSADVFTIILLSQFSCLRKLLKYHVQNFVPQIHFTVVLHCVPTEAFCNIYVPQKLYI